MKNLDKCFEQSVSTPEIAQAYVPMQKFCELFGLNEALLAGTAFPVLKK